MKLQFPFIQLPLRFDAAALAAELAPLTEGDWRPHPQGFAGNSALPLISVHGDPDDDGFAGPMRPTPYLDRFPYLKRVLGSFGAVLGRTRLMRLSGHAEVTPHVDQGHYWAERMRVHVPIVTQPTVRFLCGDAELNMRAGECWIFDTWRLHRVLNDAEAARVHLVADTVGGDGLWDLIQSGRPHPVLPVDWPVQEVKPSDAAVELEFETINTPRVMNPWELRTHIGFLFGEVQPHPALPQLHQAALNFLRRWHSLWIANGENDAARPRYRAALDQFVADMRRLGDGVLLRNDVWFSGAVVAMVAKAALAGEDVAPPPGVTKPDYGRARKPVEAEVDPEFDRPVFIVSPPRSGSTFLFETLARAQQLYTIGGESHHLIEGIAALHPAAQGFSSNRLAAADATPSLAAELRARFRGALVDRDGAPLPAGRMRMLEKTPKNALRIPFLSAIFPEANFVYLYREPREVLGSMIEAWQSGRFRTYPSLPGWDGLPWSLVLTPGWQTLRGKSLPEIVAAQWDATTRILLDDLAAVPAERRIVVRYAELVADPPATMQRLCSALRLDWNASLAKNLLPSRFTVSAPAPGKWRRHEHEIETSLAPYAKTLARAAAFA